MPPSLHPWKLSAGDGHSALVVEFVRVGDRLRHDIRLAHSGEVLLTSIEGDDEAWPPSPALQEVSEATAADGVRSLLLVGMAGKSHWSLSVHAEGSSLVFDVACRCVAAPAWLGSTYRGEKPAQIDTDSAVIASDSRIQIAAPTATRFPATIRWRYLVTSD